MFYRFDVDRWIIHQLPPALRRSGVYSFLRAFLYPLKQLIQTFTAYREAVMAQLSYNAFEIYLQKWLNDLFFYEYDDIFITDEEIPIPALSFSNEGDAPVYMTGIDEDPAVPLNLFSSQPDNRLGAFVVHVPAAMTAADISVVEQWVNYYKFAGTQYRIEQYG